MTFSSDDIRDLAVAELKGEGLDDLAIEISIRLMDGLAGAAMDAARTKLAAEADAEDNEARTLTAIHYGRVAGLMEAFALLGLPCPIEAPSEAINAAEFALVDPDGMKDFIQGGVAEAVASKEVAE